MTNLNRIDIIGNLGSEPELRFTSSGKSVTTFSIATNHRYTNSEDERREEVEWLTVVTWSRLAEQCNQFLTKGRLVFVSGRLHSQTWQGKDGLNHSKNEIIARTVIFLDKNEGSSGSGSELAPEDIPF